MHCQEQFFQFILQISLQRTTRDCQLLLLVLLQEAKVAPKDNLYTDTN
jgi:hypothetical protein